jgi:hypothetical protein
LKEIILEKLVEVKLIVLSKINQTQKDKYCMQEPAEEGGQKGRTKGGEYD